MDIREHLNGYNFVYNLLTKEFIIYQDEIIITLNPADAKLLFEMIKFIETKI